MRETWISFENEPPSVTEFRARMEAILARTPWLVAAEGEEILGYAYADRLRSRPAYQWAQETTVYVARGRQRRGVARALYGALFTALRLQGFGERLGGHRPAQPRRAWPFTRRLGFRAAGVWPAVGWKLGGLARPGMVEARPAGPRARPSPPRPLARDAARTTAWRDAGLPGSPRTGIAFGTSRKSYGGSYR